MFPARGNLAQGTTGRVVGIRLLVYSSLEKLADPQGFAPAPVGTSSGAPRWVALTDSSDWARRMRTSDRRHPPRILVLDIGGTHVKVGFSYRKSEFRIRTGPNFLPGKLVKKLRRRLKGERYDAVSIGYPGVVLHGRIVGEPHHLGRGWVGFDWEAALRHPVRIVNDAAMQAFGSYHGRRMLLLGLGTGLGTAMVIDGKLEPLELGHLPYKKGLTYEDYVGEAGLERLGRKRWEKEVFEVTKTLSDALEPDYVVLGGGNVRKLSRLPPHTERGDNRRAIVGGVRLWTGVGRAGPVVDAQTPARTSPRGRRAKSRGGRGV
jgi:hypothetical protein